ncbi:hypothetical protein F511_37694 [Dorcoceras hygrometricum]|uniref:Uncharacterized protein n=1 Tax=Dorcoceras hygrometricum TaxID=472368 RepID=A0A2Z7BE36_9LAMI|nr:hypothetical protein F511_37694 [Dorcoceras hygrometricum]
MHRLLHASGSHPYPTPYDPNQLLIRRSPIVSRCFSNNGPDKGFVSVYINPTNPNPKSSSSRRPSSLQKPPPPSPCFAGICSDQLDEENSSAPISSGLLVQADEGVSLPVVDLIDVIYRRLP